MQKLQLEILTTLLYNPFTVSIIFLIFLHKLIFRRHDDNKNLKLPPSPPKLPLIGNLHQLIGKLPHHAFHSLSAKYGPLMLLHFGQAPTVVVSSADIVEEIVKQHDVVFSNRPSTTAAKVLLYGCADFAFSPYGDYWRKARQICHSQLLSNKRVESFRFAREEEVASLLNKIRVASSNGNSVNLSEMLLATTHGIISRCVMGQMAKEADAKFGELSKRYLSLLLEFSVGDLFPFLGWMDVHTGLVKRLKASFEEMDAFLNSVIEDQMALEDAKENDFVQILLNLQKEGQLGFSEDNLKAILLDIFVAAVETTATSIDWAMAELLKNPKVMKKAQIEVRRVVGRKGKVDEDDLNLMDYLKCIIKETLRLHPAAPLMAPRETSSRVKLRGYDILPKTRVLVNVWAIQRDPKLWDNPEVFLPERFENNSIDYRGDQEFRFIPFGVGRKICPGISFGVAVLEFAIANLLYCFDWKLVGDADHVTLDMTETFGYVSHKKLRLQLVPTVYCC